MIDHISVGVADLERSARFYEPVLAPLGLSRLVTRPNTVGFGKNYPEFWINLRAGMTPVAPDSGAHVSLRAKSTGDVDAFHAAALSAGGRSDGAPGLAMPVRSPFTSARNTGTPMREKLSAITCSVTVLPVPVAPVMQPCRFASAGSKARSTAPARPMISGSAISLTSVG